MATNLPAVSRTPRQHTLYESKREREFYRYYEPIRSLSETGPSFCDLHDTEAVQAHKPVSSPDRALTAFCQLGALRIGTRRAMLFFFDQENAYILAEATRTLSLQDDTKHEIKDELWLGHTIIPRGFSVCEVTVNLPANEGSNKNDSSAAVVHIINDLSADTRFCDRPYVSEGPRARFYAGVPITTPSGINIGAYCVLDDKTRDGIDEKDVNFLRDMAATVMTHLEMVRAKAEHERGSQMVRGLGAFIRGAHNSRECAEAVRGHGDERKTSVRTDRPQHTNLARQAIANIQNKDVPSPQRHKPSFSSRSPIEPAQNSPGSEPEPKVDARPPLSTAADDTIKASSTDSVATISETASMNSSAKVSRGAEDLQQEAVSPDIRATFEHAAELIRTAVGLDGSLFLDASVGTFGGLVAHEEETGTEPSSDAASTSVGIYSTDSDTGLKRSKATTEGEPKSCPVLGGSYSSEMLDVKDNNIKHRDIGEGFLRSLLRRYPKGKVWNFNLAGYASDDDESSESGSATKFSSLATNAPVEKATERVLARSRKRRRKDQEDNRSIQRLFPGVRSLIIVGMWDATKGRWFAGCVVWTYSPIRILSSESEMSYLHAFTDVIMAEIHRLEAQKSERAKSDFVSSVSHELRSPLHGILGSVECLQDLPADSFTEGLISQIETCGRTLLDIIDNLLEFSKINYHAQRQKVGDSGAHRGRRRVVQPDGRAPLGGVMSLDADVLLDQTTEEVVESTVYSFISSRNKETLKSRRVSVILDIDRSAESNWRCRVASGGWKRICINLVSNALKYTREGYILVSLKHEPIPNRRKSFQAVLRVEDTGKGMGKEFLEHQLFQPFTQEDAFQEGTGLGMSLVSKLVGGLGGSIAVISEIGVGTSVECTIPVSHCPSRRESTATGHAAVSGRLLSNISIGVARLDDEEMLDSETSVDTGKLLLLATLEKACMQMGADYSRLRYGVQSTANVHFVTESELRQIISGPPRTGSIASIEALKDNIKGKPLIVLCDSARSERELRASKIANHYAALVEYIAQPYGPERVAKTIHSCLANKAPTKTRSTSQPATALGAFISPVESLWYRTTSVTPTQLSYTQRLETGSPKSGSDGDSQVATLSPPAVSTVDTAGLAPANSSPRRTEGRQYPFPDIRARPSILRCDNNGATLPLQRRESTLQRNISPQSLPQATVGAQSKLSLLLVDDNAINLQLLMTYCRKNDYPMTAATNGLEAVEAYKAACRSQTSGNRRDSRAQLRIVGDRILPVPAKPRVILMDINMPIMDGFEATRQIRAFEKAAGVEPATVIALTGLGSADAQREAYSSGVDLFMTKPVRLKELTKILDSIKDS